MRKLISRRTFLSGAVASIFPSIAEANIGLSASPALYKAFKKTPSVIEGISSKTIYILTTPWCPLTPKMYEDTRGIVRNGKVSLAWIMFSGGQPEGSSSLENLLKSPLPSNIQNSFVKIENGTGRVHTPLADEQDRVVFQNLESLVIQDTGRGLVTPTMVYAIGDRIRIIPGSILRGEIEYIAELIQ